jgi:tetratricopeptide (TPR) repeat protein
MRSPALLLFGAIATLPVIAQVTGGTGGTTPTTGSGGQTSVQANPNFGSGGGARGFDTSRPIYLSGRVAKEDGSTLVQNITIERVCSGIAKTVAYTDARGRFNFRWNDSTMILADASDAGSGPGRTASSAGYGSSQSTGGTNTLAADPFGNRMMNCELRANLAGYTSDTVNLFSRRSADSPDIGVIVLHPIAGVEGTSVSVTSIQAPKAAKSAYERGLQSLLKNKPADAAKDFEKAVTLYPNYADAWVNLAKLRLAEQSLVPARAALEKAMQADAKLVAPYLELGLLAAKDGDWKASGKYLDRAVELDPVDFPQAWYADAVAHYNLKNYDAAEKNAREAVKLDPRHANPRSDYLLGLVLAEKKDYAGAAAELRAFIKLAPNAPDLREVEDRLGQIEKLAGAPR